MKSHTPLTLQQLHSLRRPLRNVNIEHHNRLSRMERIALSITNRVGSMGFFMVILCWTLLWLGWNIFAPEYLQFDPFPSFAFWLFVSNLIQLFLLPLLLVGQTFQNKHAQVRAQEDFEVNTMAEREIETILAHLEAQTKLIKALQEELQRKKKNPLAK